MNAYHDRLHFGRRSLCIVCLLVTAQFYLLDDLQCRVALVQNKTKLNHRRFVLNT